MKLAAKHRFDYAIHSLQTAGVALELSFSEHVHLVEFNHLWSHLDSRKRLSSPTSSS